MKLFVIISFLPTIVWATNNIDELLGDVDVQIQANEDPNFSNYLREQYQQMQKEKAAAKKYRKQRLQREQQQKLLQKQYTKQAQKTRKKQQYRQKKLEQQDHKNSQNQRQQQLNLEKKYAQEKWQQRQKFAKQQKQVQYKIHRDLQRLPANYKDFMRTSPKVKPSDRKF